MVDTFKNQYLNPGLGKEQGFSGPTIQSFRKTVGVNNWSVFFKIKFWSLPTIFFFDTIVNFKYHINIIYILYLKYVKSYWIKLIDFCSADLRASEEDFFNFRMGPRLFGLFR